MVQTQSTLNHKTYARYEEFDGQLRDLKDVDERERMNNAPVMRLGRDDDASRIDGELRPSGTLQSPTTADICCARDRLGRRGVQFRVGAKSISARTVSGYQSGDSDPSALNRVRNLLFRCAVISVRQFSGCRT